jgi:hypothetical protein
MPRYDEQTQQEARLLIQRLREKGLIQIPHTDDRRYLSFAVHEVADYLWGYRQRTPAKVAGERKGITASGERR